MECMPKRQITRHEWQTYVYRDGYFISTCLNCPALKVKGYGQALPTFRESKITGKIIREEEPKCITRKKIEDEKTILE